MKNCKQILPFVICFLAISFAHVSVGAERVEASLEDVKNIDRLWDYQRYKKGFKRTIKGIPVTGVNMRLGKPVYDFGGNFGAFGFSHVAEYNKFGDEPIPLDEYTPDDAVLATTVHPNFLFLSGLVPEDTNPEWLNIPLRDVEVNVDLAYIEKQSLPGALSIRQTEFSQSEPSDPITLGQWMAARGRLKIDCKSEDYATIKARFRSMIPNRMYGMWAIVVGDNPRAFPIGGVPNIIVTDKYGNGEIERDISFCPLKAREGDDVVSSIIVQYHSAQETYGGAPEPVLATGPNGYGEKNLVGGWVGLVTHAHMDFPLNVELLDN